MRLAIIDYFLIWKVNIVDAMSARLNPYEIAESHHLDQTVARPLPGEGYSGAMEESGARRKGPQARGFGEDSPAGEKDVHICNFVSDFDRNGILYYIGPL